MFLDFGSPLSESRYMPKLTLPLLASFTAKNPSTASSSSAIPISIIIAIGLNLASIRYATKTISITLIKVVASADLIRVTEQLKCYSKSI